REGARGHPRAAPAHRGGLGQGADGPASRRRGGLRARVLGGRAAAAPGARDPGGRSAAAGGTQPPGGGERLPALDWAAMADGAAPATVLFTGFPGFIGMRLLPRLMELAPEARFRCLVQARFLEAARQGLATMEAAH